MKTTQSFIGHNLTVESSSNETLVGRTGIIRDETKQTFTVETNQDTITILKKPCVFIINNIRINGNTITKAPHKRLQS